MSAHRGAMKGKASLDSGNPWAHVPNEQLTSDVEEPVGDALRAALAKWLGTRLGVSLRSLTRRVGGGGGYKSRIYFAQTDGGCLVVRVPKRGTGWSAPSIGCPEYRCLIGAYAIARLSALGQPVPEVLALERRGKVLGAPFAVLRRVRGVHMTDYSEQWTDWPYPEEQWGEFLRACHSTEPVRGTGPVDDEGIGWCSSWSEYICRLLLARAQEYGDLLPPDFAPRWQAVLEDYKPWLDARPVRLLQMESNGYCNLILDPAAHRIKCVLDFEDVQAGDPLFELVVMAWYLGRRGIADHGGRTCFKWQRFYRGYGPVGWRHPLVPVYRSIMLLEKLWREDREQRAQRLRVILRRMETRPPLAHPNHAGPESEGSAGRVINTGPSAYLRAAESKGAES